MTIAVPAVDIDKLNQLSSEVTQLYNQHILGNTLSPEQLNTLSIELKKFTQTPARATALAQLGSLAFMRNDLTTMQFNYKMAIRSEPDNEFIRYNFASALYFSNKQKLAIEQLIALIPYITQVRVLVDTYKLLERELQFSQCKELITMMKKTEMANIPDAKEWLSKKSALLAAYEKLNIDLSLLHQLFDEFNAKLRPQFPIELNVQHYYEEIDDTIYYVFIDNTSNADTAFENCMALIEFISEFETTHNIDLKHFVMDYEGVKQ